MANIFKKLEKSWKISIKLRVFSDRLFKRNGEEGVHQGLMARQVDGGNSGVRATAQ